MLQTITVQDNVYLETITTFLCNNNFKVHYIATGDVQMNYNICKPNNWQTFFTYLSGNTLLDV